MLKKYIKSGTFFFNAQAGVGSGEDAISRNMLPFVVQEPSAVVQERRTSIVPKTTINYLSSLIAGVIISSMILAHRKYSKK